MAELEPHAAQQKSEDEEREERYTQIGSWRDLIVGVIFLAVALIRFLPPFTSTTPTLTGLIWISFIGTYGLYRVVRGIIKFGSDRG